MQYGQQPVFAYTASPAAPGQYAVQQPQIYQIQQHSHPVGRVYARQDAKTTVGLGIAQLVISILTIAFQSGALSIEHQWNQAVVGSTSELIGYGIWCGAMYLGAGIMGIIAGKKNSSSCIIGFLVFNIMCSVIAWVHLGFASANLGVVRSCQKNEYYNSYYVGYGYGSYASSSGYYGCQGQSFNSWVALDSLLVILSVVEFVIAVTASSICCRALGCCCSSPAQPQYFVQQPTATNIIVHSNPTQPMMTVPVGYLNQGFATGYPAQQSTQAFGYAPAAVSSLPPTAPAGTSYSPAEGDFAPPPYQPHYQDMSKGTSRPTDSSRGNVVSGARLPDQNNQVGSTQPPGNVGGNLYATANEQPHYDNVDQYEVPHDYH